MTHTPGPWEISKCPKENGAKWLEDICIYAGIKEVARIKRSENYDWETAISNATTIAATPVLIEALKDCAQRLEAYYGTEYPAVKRARQALTLAEKGQP